MKILITGATGMVGKNLTEYPQISQHTLLRPSRIELNLNSSEHALVYLKAHKPDLIIHCAGKVGGIHANMAQPVEFLVENLDMGRNLIMAAAEAGIPKLLNMGSTCMYPKDHEEKLSENMILGGPLEPTNEGYALAKILCQRLCEYISRARPELQYKTLIPCNLFGRWDKFDPKHSHLIAAIIQKTTQAKTSKNSEIEIWGDGSARREFLSASDLADAVYFCIERWSEIPNLINIGVGHDHSVLEYYKAVAKVLDFKPRFIFDRSKPVGMKRKLCSTDKINSLGWTPKKTLEQGLKEAVDFYHSQK